MKCAGEGFGLSRLVTLSQWKARERTCVPARAQPYAGLGYAAPPAY